jgi:VanZ family protein
VTAPSRPGLVAVAWRWGPAIAWAALIFVLSAQPGLKVSSDSSVDGPLRHLAHVGVYAVLAVLVVHGLGALGRPLDRRTAIIAALLTIGYGITDEIHQAFVPQRTANPIDVGYDAIGAALGLAAVWILGRVRSRLPSAPDRAR